MAKKTWDDETFRKLLVDYRRPSLDEKSIGKLLARMETVSIDSTPKKDTSGKIFHLVLSVRVARILATAAVLVIVCGLAFYTTLWRADLPLAYTLTSEGVASEGPESIRKSGKIASDRNPLSLKTANEEIHLAPDSMLSISGDPLRRISGKNGNRYSLEKGSVYIDHKRGTEPFTLLTPWGNITPLGTVLSCSLTFDGLELFCLADALSFTGKTGVSYTVHAGELLTVREKGKEVGVLQIPENPRPFGFDLLKPTQAMQATQKPKATAGINSGEPQTEGQVIAENQNNDTPAKDESVPEEKINLIWSIPYPLGKTGDAKKIRLHFGDGFAVLDSLSSFASVSVSVGKGGGSLSPAQSVAPPIESSGIADSLFIAYGKGTLAGWNGISREKIWEVPTGNLSFTSFTIYKDRIYLPSAEGVLYIHEGRDGKLVKKIDLGTGLYGMPLVTETMIYLSTLDRRILALNSADGTVRWEYKGKRRYVDDCPLLDGSALVTFSVDGFLTALDRDTGKFLWEAPFAETMKVKPVVWDDHIVFADLQGLKSLSLSGESKLIAAGEVLDIRPFPDSLYILAAQGILRIGTNNGYKTGSVETGYGETEVVIEGKFLNGKIGNAGIMAFSADGMLSSYSIPISDRDEK